MFAALFDRPELVNEQLRALPGRDAPTQIQAVARDVFRADNRVVLTYVPRGRATSDDEVGGMTPDDEASTASQTDQQATRRRSDGHDAQATDARGRSGPLRARHAAAAGRAARLPLPTLRALPAVATA